MKSLGKGRGVQLKASISKDVLSEMAWYQFAVSAENDAGMSIENVELQVLGAPSACKRKKLFLCFLFLDFDFVKTVSLRFIKLLFCSTYEEETYVYIIVAMLMYLLNLSSSKSSDEVRVYMGCPKKCIHFRMSLFW